SFQANGASVTVSPFTQEQTFTLLERMAPESGAFTALAAADKQIFSAVLPANDRPSPAVLRYEEKLVARGGVFRLRLPGSWHLFHEDGGPAKYRIHITSDQPVIDAYAPDLTLDTVRVSDTELVLETTDDPHSRGNDIYLL